MQFAVRYSRRDPPRSAPWLQAAAPGPEFASSSGTGCRQRCSTYIPH